MSLVENTAPHLPYLRRFARALTGGQKSGDAYVVSVLEALVADPGSFDIEEQSARGAVQGLLPHLELARRSISPRPTTSRRSSTAPSRRLEALTPLPRQAFLLMAVEEFTLPEIAQILGKSEAEVGKLIDQAGREIAEQVATNVLIIEDEPLIAMDIESLVQSLGHRVDGIARTHGEAMRAVEKQKPGLILADIQLADGSSGLDAVNEMLALVLRAGRLHHRLSGAAPDRRAAGAGLPDHQAVPAGDGEGGDQPGVVLRATCRTVSAPPARREPLSGDAAWVCGRSRRRGKHATGLDFD